MTAFAIAGSFSVRDAAVAARWATPTMRLMRGLVSGAGEDGVREGRGERAVAGEVVGKAEDVVVQRVQAALVALGEKLGLVGGHVDLHGALGFAGLATEAEIEGLVDGAALEAFVAQGTGEHFPEQVRAAAGGVLLLTGGAVAGAHDAAYGVAAGADADAALSGAGERSVVFCEGEVGPPFPSWFPRRKFARSRCGAWRRFSVGS